MDRKINLNPIVLLKAIAFLDLLVIGLIVPLVPSHVRSLGGNHIYVGLLGSIYAGFQMGSGPLIGSLSDIHGRKSILLATLLLCSFAYTVIGHTTSIIVILIIRGFLGIFKQTQMLTRAMVPDYEGNEHMQGEIYGKMMAISGIGITVGPVIGGHVMEDLPIQGFSYIANIVGLGFILNAGLVYLLPQPIKTAKKKSRKILNEKSLSATSGFKQPFIQIYNIKWSQYWDAFLLKGLVGFAMGVYYSTYTLFLKTQYGLSPKYIGYTISFKGTVGAFSSYFIGFINSFYNNDEDYRQRNFHVFLIMSGSLVGLILSKNIYVYTLFLIPLAVGNAMGRLVTLEMVLKRCHGENRGTLIGASNSVRSLAGVVAPMMAGFIGEMLGVSYVIYASLLASLIGLFLSYQIKHKKLKID